ncbi:hypothetical protein AURDEDRAFT_165881 [Auricularia subglabra TFB-10046 SS5]|nr:hypothetical protein AURDEDRAFT_165881 [Auricularia subglabra TFB-10046 SS5]
MADDTATWHPSADTGIETPDLVGEELADHARIWREYDRVARDDDRERVGNWNRGLDNLALFPFVQEAFTIDPGVRSANCLWIASLLLSLTAALIAIMGKDWIGMYTSRPPCNPRQWAETRTYRLLCVERWYMAGVIASAPVLLHISLALFAVGLIQFFSPDQFSQWVALALSAAAGALYFVTVLSAILFPGSPFKSPATQAIRGFLIALYLFLRKRLSQPPTPSPSLPRYLRDVSIADRWTEVGSVLQPELLAQALSMFHEMWPSPEAFHLILVALGDLAIGGKVAPLVSSDLRTRLTSEIRHKWHKAGITTLSRYVLADRNLSAKEPLLSRSQVRARFELFPRDPSLRSENALFARARANDGYLDPDMADRHCPENVIQPRGLQHILSLSSFTYTLSPHSVIILASRYWHHLKDDGSFYLHKELRQRLDPLSEEEYRSQVAARFGGHSGIIELLVFLLTSAQPEVLTASFDLIFRALDAEAEIRQHPCLVYAFGSEDARIVSAAWERRPWTYQQVRSLEKALPLVQYHSYYGCGRRPPAGFQHECTFERFLARTLIRMLSAARPWALNVFHLPGGSEHVSNLELCVRCIYAQLCDTRSGLGHTSRLDLVRLLLQESALARVCEMWLHRRLSRPEPTTERPVINILTVVARQIAQEMGGVGSSQLVRLFLFAETKNQHGESVTWDLGAYLRELSACLAEQDAYTAVSLRRLLSALRELERLCDAQDDLRASWNRIDLAGSAGHTDRLWNGDINEFFALCESSVTRDEFRAQARGESSTSEGSSAREI